MGWILLAILSPVILLIAAFCSVLGGSAAHNNSVLDLCRLLLHPGRFGGAQQQRAGPVLFRRDTTAGHASRIQDLY